MKISSRAMCEQCIRHHGAIMVAEVVSPDQMKEQYKKVVKTFMDMVGRGFCLCPTIYWRHTPEQTGIAALYEELPEWCPNNRKE